MSGLSFCTPRDKRLNPNSQIQNPPMTLQTLGLSPELLNYLRSVSLREPTELQRLRESSASHPQSNMQIAPEQGQFMALLLQLMGAKKALEVGVFMGYSGLAIALALPQDGTLVACENNEEYGAIALQHWQHAGVAHKIQLRLAPALETLDQLLQDGQGGSFDFAFIDADKRHYEAYVERSLQLLRPGGLMAIDNTLWSGRVADPDVQDNRTQHIRSLNQKLYASDRIHLSVVPIGDGLTLAIKR